MPTCTSASPTADHVDETVEGAPVPTRRRIGRKHLALALLAPLLVLSLAACEPNAEQAAVRHHVNSSRQAHGIHSLRDDVTVRNKAQSWADHLAATGSLSHSNLRAGLESVPWVSIAENVGRGGSIKQIHDAYMASSGHRSNILDRKWDVIGTGHAIARDGTVYTVHVFVDLR
jgi:uncharacterized protein YkwD